MRGSCDRGTDGSNTDGAGSEIVWSGKACCRKWLDITKAYPKSVKMGRLTLIAFASHGFMGGGSGEDMVIVQMRESRVP